MKQLKLFNVLFPFIIMCIPWIYLAIVWAELPDIIPTHFNINGVADKFGAKKELILAPAIFTVMGISVYFILRNIHRVDPRKKYTEATAKILAKIASVMILFICGITLFIIHSSVKGEITGLNIVFCAISLLIAYIGNLFHSVKPNYFAGFRLPWTLENEENWRLTHLLASKIWFAGGIVMAIVSLLVNLKIMLIVFIAGMMIMVLIPVVYSYRLYKKKQ